MIIIVEGVDNSGKTTLINNITKELEAKSNTIIVLDDSICKEYKSLDVDYFLARNSLLLGMARVYEESKAYDYIFIDRCFLSYCVYNVDDVNNKQLYFNLIKDYLHIIMYQENIEKKEDEVFSIEQLAKQQEEFLSYELSSCIKIAKEGMQNFDLSSVNLIKEVCK
jgi:ABC-type cobalamin/Fe3+-siderophores transport system ATPase subunit